MRPAMAAWYVLLHVSYELHELDSDFVIYMLQSMQTWVVPYL